jgi:hypothetical protein
VEPAAGRLHTEGSQSLFLLQSQVLSVLSHIPNLLTDKQDEVLCFHSDL